MKKITKQHVKNILGSGATAKQVEIVFALLGLQEEFLKEKISEEIKKLEEKKAEALKKIEDDFQKKIKEVSEKILGKAVQNILKKNGIEIPQDTASGSEENSSVNFSIKTN